MKLPLIAALAGLATAIVPRIQGDAVCNAGRIPTLKSGVMGFYQSFCINKNGAKVSPGQVVSQAFNNGDSITLLAVTNTGPSGDAFWAYACSTAFGLINVCSAPGDGTRTFGGTFLDGPLLYRISAKPTVRVQKAEVHPVGTNTDTAAAAGATCNPTGTHIDTASMDQHAWEICTKFAGRKIKRWASAAAIQEYETFTYGGQDTTLYINCRDDNEHVINFSDCYAGFRAIDACQPVVGLTNGGQNTASDGMWYYELILDGLQSSFNASRPLNDTLVTRQVGPKTLTCNSRHGEKEVRSEVKVMVDKFCLKNLGQQLRKGDRISNTFSASRDVTFSISNDCAPVLYLPPNLCNESLQAIADCTVAEYDPRFTYGGHRTNECLGFDIGISPRSGKQGNSRELVASSNLIERRPSLPKNCINKADPACQIAQWTCTYGNGYTIPQDQLNKAINGFCGSYHGHYIKAGEWFARVWHNEGHEIWMAIHTSGKVDFLLDINLCTWYFDGIRDQCNTGKGTQGGYDWIPPSGLTFVLGVDGTYNENSEYCGGYC